MESITGLINNGNKCYLNSIIQALYYSKDFRELLLEQSIMDSDTITGALKKIFYMMVNDSTQQTDPRSLERIIGSRNGTFGTALQADANELLLNVFNWIEEETKNENLMLDVFNVEIKSGLECSMCNNVSINTLEHVLLTLNIPVYNQQITLVECIRDFIKNNIIEFDCEKCKQNSTGKLIYKITPKKNLIIYLNRSYQTNNNILKNDADVVIPMDLVIDKNRYELYATVNHTGGHNSGHYYNFCKSDKGNWYYISDTQVSYVNDVPESHNAVLCFYRKSKK